jgi:prepilin signal peptidase PulO-like enzyme (type II secretory pathway)
VFLGPLGVLMTIALASLAGLAIGVGWALATRTFASPFGFAPAIAAGALIALLAPSSLQLF